MMNQRFDDGIHLEEERPLISSLSEGWNDELRELQRKKNPSFLRMLFVHCEWKFVLCGILQFLILLFQLYLLGELVNYIQTGEGGIYLALGYTFGIIALSICLLALLSGMFDQMRLLRSAMRLEMMESIIDQTLNLTTVTRKTKGTME